MSKRTVKVYVAQKDYERTLGLVNRLRRKMKLKPVKALKKGRPGCEDSCPIANTMLVGVPKRAKICVGVDEGWMAYMGNSMNAKVLASTNVPAYAKRVIHAVDVDVNRGWRDYNNLVQVVPA